MELVLMILIVFLSHSWGQHGPVIDIYPQATMTTTPPSTTASSTTTTTTTTTPPPTTTRPTTPTRTTTPSPTTTRQTTTPSTTTPTTARPSTTPSTPPIYHPDPFFRHWISYEGGPVYLDNYEASYFYSLGQYRPDTYREYPPNEYYPSEPPYEYPYNGGGSGSPCPRCQLIPRPKRRRIEFRQLTDAERVAFTNGILALSNYCPSSCGGCPSVTCRSALAIFIEIHQFVNSPGAHFGASFLPWHREFLFRFENALILNGNYPDDLGIPTWDSILDSTLPNARQSVLWTSQYAGANSGTINTTPLPGYNVPGLCGGTLNRGVTLAPDSNLYTENHVTVLMNQMCFAHLFQNFAWACPFGACNFEGTHNGPHNWVGGDMASFCSPIDPVFWMHHAFIDCLWEDFRNGAQMTDLEREYPLTNNGGAQANWDAPMLPFPGLYNAQGLSTHYTRYYYYCAERASGTVCETDVQCNPRDTTNPALWCDRQFGRCRSRIQEGGSCIRSYVTLPNNACWCNVGTAVCTAGFCRCL